MAKDNLGNIDQIAATSAKLLHIKLNGEINYNSKTFTASAVLKFEVSKEVDSIELEAYDFTISAVSLNGLDSEFNYDRKIIGVKVPKTIKDRNLELKVDYAVVDPPLGMYFITKDKYGPYVQEQLWTLGEGHTNDFTVVEDNHYWFPYVTGPASKCTSETIITVPKPQEIISNGSLVEVEDLGEKRRFHWKMDLPHSPYLISLVAGTFDTVEEKYRDVRLMYIVPKGRKSDVNRTFKFTEGLFKFYEDYTGFRYPHEKFSQTCVFGATYGGMENTTANTITERTLHDETAEMDFSSEENIGHHLAHQWFGDIVTCGTWEDVWLNEGLAAFAYAVYLRDKYGDAEFFSHVLDKIDMYVSVEKKRGVSEVCTTYGPEPRKSFDRFNSEKGGLVMLSLEQLVGRDLMRKTIQEYFTRFSFKTARTKDLEHLIREVTGYDPGQFFSQYVYSRGYPSISVAYSYSSTNKLLSVYVRQEQKGREYDISISLTLNFDGKPPRRVLVTISERSQSILIPCEITPSFVCVDPELSIVGDLTIRESLESTITKIEVDSHYACRIRAIRSIASSSSEIVVKTLSKILSSREEHWSISAEAARTLSKIGTKSAFEAIKENRKNANSRVRKSIARALGELCPEESLETLKLMLSEEKSYYVRSEIMHSIGKTGFPEAFPTLVAGISERSHNHVVPLGAIRGMGALGTKECAETLMWIEQTSEVKELKLASIAELSRFMDDEVVRKEMSGLIESLDLDIREAAFSIARKHGDREYADKAKDLFIRRYYIESQSVTLV